MENSFKTKFKARNSIIIKVMFILFMILLLMIPNMMIRDLIRERSGRKLQIENEVATSYGQEQKIMPPILRIPYTQKYKNNYGNEVTKNGTVSYYPDRTDIDGILKTDVRERSIYDVVVYNSELDIHSNIIHTTPNAKDVEYDYDNAYLIVGLSDPTALLDDSSIKVNGKDIALDGATSIESTEGHTYSYRWIKTESFAISPESELKTITSLIFKGTKSLSIEPVGESMKVKLSSPWPDPSFVGTQLPKHDVTSEGFTSTWEVNKFIHNRPQFIWDYHSSLHQGFSFGVNLIQPIDEYGKNNRTAKYALLLISLSFGIFFFFEVLFKELIHPIQYTLVGFSLSIFFLLLLSITEHLGFDRAYLISSCATIAMIVTYSSSILKSRKAIYILSLLLLGLFGYIFIILQMQDFALLAGALSLFAVLAAVMFLSRNINWYKLSETKI